MLDIIKCPRCGLDHKALVKAYVNPIIIGDVEITHWAFCETWDEPILVTEIDDGYGAVSFWRFQ